MKFACLIIFTLSVFFFSSCKDDSVASNGTAQFFPLKVGNQWYYEYTRYDSLGTTMDSFDWIETVDGDTTINGQKYYSISDLFSMFFGIKFYYTNKSDGLYKSYDDTRTFHLLFKFPAQLNEHIYNESDTLTVINIIPREPTPTGFHFCIVYQKITQSNSLWNYENTYISPGTGKIKVEYGYTRDKINYIKTGLMELKQYNLQ